MSTDHPHYQHGDAVEHYHDTEIVHDNDGSPNWWVRLGLGVGGIVLLLGALAAWQMQDRLGVLGVALPWLIAGAVILGAAAIVESVTVEIWVTLVAGLFLLGIAFLITGRVTVALDAGAHDIYVVDRFTGQVRLCDAAGCREFGGFGSPSVKVNLPSADQVRDRLEKK